VRRGQAGSAIVWAGLADCQAGIEIALDSNAAGGGWVQLSMAGCEVAGGAGEVVRTALTVVRAGLAYVGCVIGVGADRTVDIVDALTPGSEEEEGRAGRATREGEAEGAVDGAQFARQILSAVVEPSKAGAVAELVLSEIEPRTTGRTVGRRNAHRTLKRALSADSGIGALVVIPLHRDAPPACAVNLAVVLCTAAGKTAALTVAGITVVVETGQAD
jgi:hypothetical protein